MAGLHDRYRSLLTRIFPDGSKSGTAFPDVRYFAVMGELAENYAGTSSVLFHRSNAISEDAGLPVEILVFGHVRDYVRLNDEMHADGRLAPNVYFRSMWKELADLQLVRDHSTDFSAFSPMDDSSTDEVIAGEGVPLRRFRRDSDGKNLQIDMLRADGSIIVSDRRDVSSAEHRGSRSVILCNQASEPIAQFRSLRSLRYFWLDSVISSDRAVLFSDTLGMAGVTHSYRRPNVVVIQTFHNRHLRQGTDGALGYTGTEALTLLKNLDNFDAAVFLSQRQLDDVDSLMGPAPARRVIPNSRTIRTQTSERPRPRNSGIMLSQLNARKQPDHAVRAIVQANARLQEPVSLDIFGEGTEREHLETMIDGLGASTVRLRGYDSVAASKFADSTFSLLTSKSEALPLVIVESMSRGCIPIAYDIKYGPRDIITDGVDGFLIPEGDIDGLADAIVRLQSTSEDSISQLRKNTIRRAQDFSDSTVLKQWADLINAANDTKVAPARIAIEIKSCTHERESEKLTVKIAASVQRKLTDPRSYLTFLARDSPAVMRIPGEVIQSGRTQYSFTVSIEPSRLDWFTRGIFDVSLELYDRAGNGSIRLRSESSDQSVGNFLAYSTAHGNFSLKRL